MLWSPVVRHSNSKPEYDQFSHLARVEQEIKAKTHVVTVFTINQKYLQAINELRSFAAHETKELKSPVMRFLQIEEWCRRNAENASNKPMHPTA